jgi:hypothetical protein
VGRSHAGKNRIHTVNGREDYNSVVAFLRNECVPTHINPRKSKTFTPYPLSCNFEPIRRYSNAARTVSSDGTIRIGLATPLPCRIGAICEMFHKRSDA